MQIVGIGQYLEHPEHELEMIRLALGAIDAAPGAGNIGRAGTVIVLFRVISVVVLDGVAARLR